MGDENQPSKKRAAGRELSRDNPGLDEEEDVPEQEMGSFKKASDEVLASRRIVKVRRQQTSAEPAAPSNPFAGIRLVPPTVPAATPADATTDPQATEDKKTGDDAGKDDETKSEAEVTSKDSEEKPHEAAADTNKDEEKAVPAEQAVEPSEGVENASEPSAIEGKEAGESSEKRAEAEPTDEKQAEADETANDDKIEDEKPNASGDGGDAPLSSFKQLSNSQNAFTGLAGESSEKRAEVEPTDEKQAEADETANDDKIEDEKPNASGGGGDAPLSSFKQLSNSQNAFTGLAGTGFSSSSFSFGSIPKDASSSESSLPSFSFGTSNNGSTSLFGTTGTSLGSKTEGAAFRSMPEVPRETGEENEDTVFSADSALFEFFDGGWKERGKGEVKLNVLKDESQKARLVMRAKGNLRLILNASLYPDMKLTKMDKKGITFACVNIATEGKDGLSTFALKFKDVSVVEEFSSAVSAHKGKPATTLKTPENSPKASDD